MSMFKTCLICQCFIFADSLQKLGMGKRKAHKFKMGQRGTTLSRGTTLLHLITAKNILYVFLKVM